MKPITEATQLLCSRFETIFHSERYQFILTIGLVLLLIIGKGQSADQPGIVGSVVRHYIEETSASIVPSESNQTITDISSLMGAHAAIVGSAGKGGQYDTQNEEETPYILLADSVQAVTAISLDYLDNYKSNRINEYIIQPGDTLSFIASDYGVSMESILWANKLSSPDSVKPGQALRIPPVSGVIHMIQEGDTVSKIAQKYKANDSKIVAFNNIGDNDTLAPGTDLIIPDGIISIVRPAATIARGSVKAAYLSSITNVAQRFTYLPDLGEYFKVPTTGFDWGIVHGRNGVDVANSCGTPILASADGTVTTAVGSGYNGGYGKYIKIVHENQTETLYAHLSKVTVTPGETVAKGRQIGLMGTTGRSTGCHLHFEVHGARNPLAIY